MQFRNRVNLYSLVSALIWGLLLSFGLMAARQNLTISSTTTILLYIGNFLALALYPILITLIVRWRTTLWVNVFSFAWIGSLVASMGIFSLNSYTGREWFGVALGLAGIWIISMMLVPRIQKLPAVQKEWNTVGFQRLNNLSLVTYLFLAIPPFKKMK